MHKKISLLFIFIMVNGSLLFAQAPIQPGVATVTSQRHDAVTAILGAFPPEVDILRSQIQQKKESIFQNIRFTEGLLNGKHVVLAQTGIGKANAASTTALMLEHFNPAQLIFTGIAGGVNPSLQPGDIVIGTHVAYHDYGTITPDSMLRRPTRNPFTMQENPEYFTSDTSLIRIANIASKNAVLEKVKLKTPQVINGIIVTGDVFVASGKATQNLRQGMQRMPLKWKVPPWHKYAGSNRFPLLLSGV